MELWIGKVFKYKNKTLLIKKEKIENECAGCYFYTGEKICCKDFLCKGNDIIFVQTKKEEK